MKKLLTGILGFAIVAINKYFTILIVNFGDSEGITPSLLFFFGIKSKWI